MCALQCDKMGAEWNSRFKKVRGLDFCKTGPSGSDREGRKKKVWSRKKEMDDVGNKGKKVIKDHKD